MLHRVPLVAGSLMLAGGVLPALRAADDEPTVRGRTASEWLEMLHQDPQPQRRRAALIALGILGPNVRGVVPGVGQALKDADVEVRRGAAQLLAQMGPDGNATL